MNRPRLEVASWIAGILSAVVAVFALLPSPSAKRADPAPAPQNPVGQADVEVNRVAPTYDPITTKSELIEAIAIAKQINALTPRDAELTRLAKLAIKREEFSAAISAAEAIQAQSLKDDALLLASCYAIHLGKADEAKKAASLIGVISKRDSARVTISQVTSIKSGEGPNEPNCGSL